MFVLWAITYRQQQTSFPQIRTIFIYVIYPHTVLGIVSLQAKLQGCSIFLSGDFFFSAKLVLNHLEMGVVDNFGVVPQEFNVFNYNYKFENFKECKAKFVQQRTY